MRLQVGAVDQDRLPGRPRLRQLDEDPREDPHARPADEPVVERLRRAVDGGRILPVQAVLLDVDDPAQNPAIIDPWPAPRPRKERPQPIHLRVAPPKVPAHLAPPCSGTWIIRPDKAQANLWVLTLALKPNRSMGAYHQTASAPVPVGDPRPDRVQITTY